MRNCIGHIGLFLLLPFLLIGQELRFQNLTMEDGFAHNGQMFPNAILKDREGFVWFATLNGLSRYDGEHFKNYKFDPSNPSSIPGNLLTVIGEDGDGRIWIGTVVHGIYIFDKEKEIFSTFQPDVDGEENLINGITFFIKKDRNGNMWCGGEYGLFCWKKSSGQIQTFPGEFEDANAFLQQSSGAIWVGDKKGLHRKWRGNDKFEYIPFPEKANAGVVLEIFEKEDGNFWIAAGSNNFWEFDPVNIKFKDLTGDQSITEGFIPVNLRAGLNGDAWMRHANGILRYNQRTTEKHLYTHDPKDPLSLPPPRYEDILVDSFGSLFVLTGNHGIAVAHTNTQPFEAIGDFETMEILALDDRRVLIRDFKKGGIIYDSKEKAISSEKLPVGPGNIFIPSLALRGDSLLWIWNDKGVKSYHLKTGKLTAAPNNPLHSLYVNLDKKGRVWNSLTYLDEDQNKWVDVYPELKTAFPELASERPSYANILFDEKNRLWARLEGDKKMLRYDFDSKEGKRYNIDGSPFKGSDGRFYLSSPEGLAVYRPEKDSFFILTEKDGMMHSGLFHVEEDMYGNAWIATPRGLQKYDWRTNSFSDIDFEDGFPIKGDTRVYHSECDKDGYIYFVINFKKVGSIMIPSCCNKKRKSSPLTGNKIR